MNELNIVPYGHNKSVYFILPLAGLNKFSFGEEDNFLNSYVSYNGKIVVVIKCKVTAGNYMEHTSYVTDFDVEIAEGINGTAIVYNVPEQFEQDMAKFLDGKYSKMSLLAKNVIYEKSTLPYRLPIPASVNVNTHKLLLVLDKNQALKKWMEKVLSLTIFEEQELLEKPNYDLEFMDIDTIIT